MEFQLFLNLKSISERYERKESMMEDVIPFRTILNDSPPPLPRSNPIFTALLKYIRFLVMSCVSPDNVYTHVSNDPPHVMHESFGILAYVCAYFTANPASRLKVVRCSLPRTRLFLRVIFLVVARRCDSFLFIALKKTTVYDATFSHENFGRVINVDFSINN